MLLLSPKGRGCSSCRLEAESGAHTSSMAGGRTASSTALLNFQKRPLKKKIILFTCAAARRAKNSGVRRSEAGGNKTEASTPGGSFRIRTSAFWKSCKDPGLAEREIGSAGTGKFAWYVVFPPTTLRVLCTPHQIKGSGSSNHGYNIYRVRILTINCKTQTTTITVHKYTLITLT